MNITIHTLFYSHVSIGSQHVSHVSGVGELPAINVLYNNNGLVRCTGWFHYISFGVLYLDLLAKPPIVQPITNITGAGIGFICHLQTGSRYQAGMDLLHLCKHNDKAFCANRSNSSLHFPVP